MPETPQSRPSKNRKARPLADAKTAGPSSRAAARLPPRAGPPQRSRSRTVSPLEVRAWVADQPPEAMYTELRHRIAALDAGIASHRETFLQTGRALFESVLKRMGWPAAALPELPQGAQRLVVRGAAANIVVGYWAEHEYRPGAFLPPIMIRGVPWDTFPHAIHLLDLDVDRISTALEHIQLLGSADPSAVRQLSEAPHDALLLLGAAQSTIRTLGPLAVFDPGVHAALFTWLRTAHYAPTKEEAAVAAKAAAGLLDEFLPDLSRRMTRTPERLDEVQGVFKDLLKKVERVMHALRSQGPTTQVLSLARAELGPGIARRDLAGWRRREARAVALERLAHARRGSVKALTEQLRLAEKAAAIDEAWEEFLTHLQTLPDAQQQAILTALPPLVASPAKPPGSPTEK